MIPWISRAALPLLLLVAFPPLLLGVIGRTKAWFAGRRGPPLLQPYRDLSRLLRKGAVYSRTTTAIFRAAPALGLASALGAGSLVPLVGSMTPLSFAGDMILFAYLLGLGRFATALAALDTGSSFEGMGASREMAFSALAEPVLFLVLALVAVESRSISFAGAFSVLTRSWAGHGAPLALAVLALFAVLLAESSRVPVDDPATHLELTMIHEVMVLDHGGPDLALLLEASAVKLFVLSALAVHLLIPAGALAPLAVTAAICGGAAVIAVLIGCVESTIARLRLPRVPQFLIAAGVLAGTGLAILLSAGG